MKIAILIEGKTEQAFKPHLIRYLELHLRKKMPKLDFHPCDHRIPKEEKLKKVVEKHLHGINPADHVIALTDLYTGTHPPEFQNTDDAKAKMKKWVGACETRFHPHVAKHDFEAWLLPYWKTVQKLAGHNKQIPSELPESVNHNKPPSFHIKEIFERGTVRESYNKARDAGRILRDNDLSVAVNKCPELKAFVNTILRVCNAQELM